MEQNNNILPILYHLGKTGAIYQWRTWTEGAIKYQETGQVGGKLQIFSTVCEAKNVGRANATTPEEQAFIEAKADWQHKLDRKYCIKIEDVKNRRIDAMLAKSFKDAKKNVRYPVHIEPKLDGSRCLAYWKNDRIVLQTRGQKEWDLPHIKKELEKILPKDAIFDGELYRHGFNRQTIQKWITKHYPDSIHVGYHVYDIPMANGEEYLWHDPNGDGGSRYEQLQTLIPMETNENSELVPHCETPHIFRVETWQVENEHQVMMCQEKCIQAGYEGCMVRTWMGPYIHGKRSGDLLKCKTFQDEEFEVVAFTDGTGKNVGVVTWKCKINTPCTKKCDDYCKYCTFDCVPIGTYAERMDWFQRGKEFVGKMLTVKFQGFSNDLIPQFPNGVAFRLPEDTSITVVEDD